MRPKRPDGTEVAGGVVEYGLGFMFFAPSRAQAGEGCTLWDVPRATQVYGELWEPIRDTRSGRPERSFADVWFVGAGALPWLAVSRETFYRAHMRDQQGADGKMVRDEAIAAARQFQSAAEVEKLRQQMDETDREVTETLQKAELERMTSEERRMPTYINNAQEEGPIATDWRLTRTFKTLDWAAINQLLDQPRREGSGRTRDRPLVIARRRLLNAGQRLQIAVVFTPAEETVTCPINCQRR